MTDWDLHKEKITEFLRVTPIVEMDGASYVFRVEKERLILELTIIPHISDVRINLRQEGIDTPLFKARIKESTGVGYIKSPDGSKSITIAYGWECLEITAPKIDHYHPEDGWIIPTGVRIKIDPGIMVEVV